MKPVLSSLGPAATRQPAAMPTSPVAKAAAAGGYASASLTQTAPSRQTQRISTIGANARTVSPVSAGNGRGSLVPTGQNSFRTGDAPAAATASPLSQSTSGLVNGHEREELAALERRMTSTESNLKEVHALLRNEQSNPSSIHALRVRVGQLKTEVAEARSRRQDYEVRAARLEELLQQEWKEREAWLDTFSNAMQKTLSDLSNCVDQSIAESNNLMKGRLDVADSMMKKLVQQLNNTLASTENPNQRADPAPQAVQPPTTPNSSLASSPAKTKLSQETSDPSSIMESMAALLQENQRLQQQQQELILRKKNRRTLVPGQRSTGSSLGGSLGGSRGGSGRSSPGAPAPEGMLLPGYHLTTVPET